MEIMTLKIAILDHEIFGSLLNNTSALVRSCQNSQK